MNPSTKLSLIFRNSMQDPKGKNFCKTQEVKTMERLEAWWRVDSGARSSGEIKSFLEVNWKEGATLMTSHHHCPIIAIATKL